MIDKSSKEKLIEATIEAIYKNGLHSVTTSKIAKLAKLSEAMIYKNFGNKDDMIIESFMSIKADLNNYVNQRLSEQMSFETMCYNIWLGHIEYFITNPKALRILNQVEHSNYMTDTIREACLVFSNTVMDFFNRGLIDKIFKPMHIEIAIALFFSPILSISEAIIEKRLEKTEENLKLVYDSTMLALRL